MVTLNLKNDSHEMLMSADPIILGLEGTAHTFGVGIVQGSNILADEREQYIPPTGGIHPRESAVHMAKNLQKVLNRSFDEAKIRPNELDAVAFSIDSST